MTRGRTARHPARARSTRRHLLAAILLLAGCAYETETTAPRAPAVDWPPTGQVGAPCDRTYPEGLAGATVAFDGTVTAVQLGEEVPLAGGRRITLTFRVDEIVAGPNQRAARLQTWGFFVPDDPRSLLGARALISTGASTDEIEGCGYSRPWTVADAAEWHRIFGR